ncbi:MAG TPA: helix-turn-helix domain-containing protein, partial [Streptosporangiaceae bacterium]|nr:helix-turn-helix domain-containing protein [Streptosporangiaceae bacterium]
AGAGRAGPRRARVLDVLRDADVPLGAADVAARTGVHVNTARFHLDALVAEGTVVRALEEPSGAGRPRAVYTPRPGMNRGGTRSYRLLSQILLSNLSSAGPDAGETARRAGQAWGGFLSGPPAPFQRLSAGEAVTRLTALLDDLGFDPDPGQREPGRPGSGQPGPDAVIRLRHCPFLELAEEYGDLVCRIHLGLMQGALAELRAPVTAAGLEPFAEPGACLARLEPATVA